jgi:integrase
MRRKVLSSLKSMLTFCQGKGRVAQNVASAVKIKSDDKRDMAPIRAGVDFPSRDELRTILEKAEGRWRPLITTAIFTGMRASELRGLPWANVDLDGGVIHVRQRADHWGKIGKPKSKAGNRDIPLTPMAINALRAWRDQCPPGSLGLVFPNETGGIEHHKTILRGFWEPFQIANGMTVDGVPKYGLHALRHAAASLFIAHLGWTPKRVQAVLGHSSIQMTYDRYGHLFEDGDSDREAMKKLEAAVVAA